MSSGAEDPKLMRAASMGIHNFCGSKSNDLSAKVASSTVPSCEKKPFDHGRFGVQFSLGSSLGSSFGKKMVLRMHDFPFGK